MKCQWKTIAGTAKSPDDFIDSTGAVEFAPGARSSAVNITIIDNDISELEKTFRVELFNAEGGGRFYNTLLSLSAVRNQVQIDFLPEIGSWSLESMFLYKKVKSS